MGKIWDGVRQFAEEDRKKIGGMSLGASARLGLEELRQAVALDGSVADRTQTPLGMYGTITPGEVSTAREDDGTVHGPKEAGEEKDSAREADPVAAARQQAAASNREKERDGLSR